MEDLHLQGRLLVSHDDEHGVVASLRFTQTNGGYLAASSHED